MKEFFWIFINERVYKQHDEIRIIACFLNYLKNIFYLEKEDSFNILKNKSIRLINVNSHVFYIYIAQNYLLAISIYSIELSISNKYEKIFFSMTLTILSQCLFFTQRIYMTIDWKIQINWIRRDYIKFKCYLNMSK